MLSLSAITAETLLSFLRTDQFIGSVRIEMCSVYLLSVQFMQIFPFPRVSWKSPTADVVA